MKRIAKLAAVLAPLLAVGCTSVLPVAVGPGTIGSKRGEASGVWLFGLIPLQPDCGIETAAMNGGIDKVATVDMKTLNVLGIVVKRTTIVTGEGEGSADGNSEVVTVSEIGSPIADVDEDIVIVNAMPESNFTVRVEVMPRGSSAWTTRGTARLKGYDSRDEVGFGPGRYDGKLINLESIRLTTSFSAPFTVNATTGDGNLYLTLRPAE